MIDFICPHFTKDPLTTCNGCQYWDIDYKTEIQLKKENLKSKLNSNIDIEVKTPSHFDIRTRFDFIVENNQLGLYGRGRQFIPIHKCHVLNPQLQLAYEKLQILFAKSQINIKKGSLRLRLSEDSSKWGLWIDFSNADIKNLLIEKSFLASLSEVYRIEIGQKRKRLDIATVTQKDHLEQFKLTEPQAENWFKTKDNPLLCSISSFTQPSWETADLITDQVIQWCQSTRAKKLIEYGSGIGQFTKILTQSFDQIDVFETDLKSLENLKINLTDHLHQIHFNNFNIFKSPLNNSISLVNPPRSGLQKFCTHLVESQTDFIIYISCFPDTFKQDYEVLGKNYKLDQITLIDQFPRTTHYEICALLKRV